MTHPSEIYEDMKTAGEHLRKAIDELERVSAQAVLREHAAELAWDEAYLNAEGSEQTRKSTANLKTQEERLESKGLKARETTVKQSIRAWQSILSSLQSAASAFREEAKLVRSSSGDLYQ